MRLPKSLRLVFLVASTLGLLAVAHVSAAQTRPQLKVLDVDVDIDSAAAHIYGENLVYANDDAAAVTVAGEPATVVSVSAGEILIDLPGAVSPGEFLLSVSRGPGPLQNDQIIMEIQSAQGSDCTNLVQEADLVACDLSGASIVNVVLHGAKLTRADLSAATIAVAQMIGVDLRYAVLDDAGVIGTVLDAGSLDGASLERAFIDGSYLNGATFRGANLRDAVIVSSQVLSGAFSGAVLVGATLDFSELSGADFSAATLVGANLNGANLLSACFKDANLRGVALVSANLLGAELTHANLDGVQWLNTTCPDGTNSDLADGDGFTCLSNLGASAACY